MFCQILLNLNRNEPVEFIQIVADNVVGIIKLEEYKSSPSETIKLFVNMFAKHEIYVNALDLRSKADAVVENYELEKTTDMFNVLM
jgi:hypothetical protein